MLGLLHRLHIIIEADFDSLSRDNLRDPLAVTHEFLACRNLLIVVDHRALDDRRVIASFTFHLLDYTVAFVILVRGSNAKGDRDDLSQENRCSTVYCHMS